MILNKQQIEEIENSGGFGLLSDIPNLLETVKALRKENDEQRELLKKALQWIGHDDSCESIAHGDCDCGYSETDLHNQIEEHLKWASQCAAGMKIVKEKACVFYSGLPLSEISGRSSPIKMNMNQPKTSQCYRRVLATFSLLASFPNCYAVALRSEWE